MGAFGRGVGCTGVRWGLFHRRGLENRPKIFPKIPPNINRGPLLAQSQTSETQATGIDIAEAL